jgi:hypothetical protein
MSPGLAVNLSPSLPQRALAVALAVLVVGMGMLAVSADWHEAVHAHGEDTGTSSHDCPITHWAGGEGGFTQNALLPTPSALPLFVPAGGEVSSVPGACRHPAIYSRGPPRV